MSGRSAVWRAPTFALLLLAGAASAVEPVRDQEIRECRPGEIVTWKDGQDRPAVARTLRFAYHHAGAPAWFTSTEIERMLTNAALAWSQCGIRADVVSWAPVMDSHPGLVRVQWSELGSRGNFGLANLIEKSLSLGPQAFRTLRERNPAHDARQTLQMVISHEMGHLFGLMAHSRRCVDVTSYYHNGAGEKCYSRDPAGIGRVVEYRHILPTACDIERCRRANALSAGSGRAASAP